MSRRIAVFLSWILHPSLIPSLFLFLLFYCFPHAGGWLNHKGQVIVFLIIFIFTFLFPLLVVLLLLQRKVIFSLEMKTSPERRFPFIAALVSYLAAFYLLREIRLPMMYQLALLGASLALLAACVINLYWKISIHMIGIGGLAALIFGMNSYYSVDLMFAFIAIVLLAGLLGTARLSLGSHSASQVYIGFLVGFFSELLLLFI